MNKIVDFVKQAHEELKKVQWPAKKVLLRLTGYVIGVSLGVGLFVMLFDYLFNKLLGLIIIT